MVNLLKKIAKLAIASILGVYLLIWALSPILAHYFVSDYLETQQLALSPSTTIRYNPFFSQLSIKDASITNGQSEKVAGVSSLLLELSLYQLLEDKIRVSEFSVDGLYAVVNKNSGLLSIGGIEIPASADSDSSQSKTFELEATNSDSAFAFKIVMKKMTLQNSLVDITEEGHQHLLRLDNIEITDVGVTQSRQNFSLNLMGGLDGADISISASAAMIGNLGTLGIDVAVSNVNVNQFGHLITPHIQTLQGLINYQGSHTIKIADSGIQVEIENLMFSSQNVEAHKNGLQLILGEQELKTSLLSLEIQSESGLKILAGGELLFRDLNIYNKSKSQVLLALKELTLDEIGIDSDEGQYEVSVKNISILDSFLSDNIENEMPALTEFSSLNINNTTLTNNALVINTIELGGLKTSTLMDKDKVIQNLIFSIEEVSAALSTEEKLGKNKNEKVIDDAMKDRLDNDERTGSDSEILASSESNVDEPIFDFKLNQFSLVSNAGIQFSDFGVSPSYNRYISMEHLSAGPFDTKIPNQRSIIKLKGRSNKYASFDFTINAKPFLDVPRYQLKGNVKEIDLPGLSAYIKAALGYEINSGQLDLNLDVELIGSKMDGESNVLLRGIELTSIDNHEAESSSIQTSIPFNAALGMLKDGDGNVELDLPLSGDINSPSFGFSGFLTLLVKQATIIGAREYLAVTLVPYAGLVTVVVVADRYMLKVQINNLDYPPTEDSVPVENDMFLSAFSSLLKDKPDLNVKLCGVSTAEDIGKERGSNISGPDDIRVLKSLAIKRAINFKEYMVEEKGIASSRLLLCNPKIDSSFGAIPHVKFET